MEQVWGVGCAPRWHLVKEDSRTGEWDPGGDNTTNSIGTRAAETGNFGVRRERVAVRDRWYMGDTLAVPRARAGGEVRAPRTMLISWD